MEDFTTETIRCYNMKCETLMKSLSDKSVDCILTDIPYLLDLHGGGGHCMFKDRALLKKGKDNPLYGISKGFDYDTIFPQFIRILKTVNILMFCSNKQISGIMGWWEKKGYSATLLVWDKPAPMPTCNHKYVENLEFIVYVRGKNATYNNLGVGLQNKCFRYGRVPARQRVHPAQKPLSLLKHLLMLHTNAQDLVFDPYAGSFSTAIGCLQTNRRFIGCETDKDIYNKGMKSLDNQVKQQTLFT